MRAGVLRASGAAFLMALLLAACGGGQQVERFVATRVIAFGDESSVILDTGYKYTVNALSSGQLACKSNPIWNQTVAVNYGLVFPQCNPDAVSVSTPSIIEATAQAKAADVSTQIDQFIAQGNSFAGKDLVTVMAGMYDVLAAYNAVKAGTMSEADATSAVETAGAFLASQVNRIAQAGGKVVVTTIYDVGTTPFGINAGTTDAALLTHLTARFNSRLRINLINDGHMIGLVLADETFSAIVKNPSGNGYVNVVKGACDPAHLPPACTTDTLITVDGTAASGDTWLWADDLHLSPAGQRTLAALALHRATNNPF